MALRSALGPDVALLADANCRYSVDDVRADAAALAEAGVGWLEEPFPPYQDRSWRAAAALRRPVLPLAAGENCYTRYEFQRLVDGGTASVVQPDLSRCGGITEAVRIAALASAAGLPVCTHGCHTGLNFAASVHYLASIDNAWYFEADGSDRQSAPHDRLLAVVHAEPGRDGRPAGGPRARRGGGRGLPPRPPAHRRPHLALTAPPPGRS